MMEKSHVLAIYPHETLPHTPSRPKLQLFNLAKDKPDLVAKLHQSWLDWSATLPPRANPQ